MMVHHSYSSNIPMNSYDSSNDEAMLLHIGFDSAGVYPHPNYLRNKDSISLEYYSGSQDTINRTRSTLIYFILDSANNELKNFSIAYVYQYIPVGSPNGHYEYYKASAHFSVLGYVLSGDSLFIVNESGTSCRTKLDSAYYWSYINDVSNGDMTVGKSDRMDSLLEDTASYNCSLAFALTKIVDAVAAPHSVQQAISVSTSLPDHTIHFSFSAIDHVQTLFLYDILGREIARAVISSGTTQYSIRFSEFHSGYCFARLGNLTGSFIAP